jgi:hypothetical protein
MASEASQKQFSSNCVGSHDGHSFATKEGLGAIVVKPFDEFLTYPTLSEESLGDSDGDGRIFFTRTL